MKNIHVGNLSVEATEAGVGAAFAVFGPVQSVSIVRDKQTGVTRGFGFVHMENSDQADAAIAGLNGTQLDGSTLAVTEARSRGAKTGFTPKSANAVVATAPEDEKPESATKHDPTTDHMTLTVGGHA